MYDEIRIIVAMDEEGNWVVDDIMSESLQERIDEMVAENGTLTVRTVEIIVKMSRPIRPLAVITAPDEAGKTVEVTTS